MFIKTRLIKNLALAFGGYCVLAACSSAVADTLTGSYSVPGLGESFSVTGNSFLQESQNYPTSGTYFGWYPAAMVAGDLPSGTVALAAMAGNGFGDTTQSDASSSIVYQTTVTNSGNTAQAFDFNFHLAGGALTVFDSYDNSTLNADFSAVVAVNNSTVWSTAAQLTSMNNSLSQQGSDIGYNVVPPNMGGYQTVSFDQYTGLVSLGILNPGQSETVSYTLSTSASVEGTLTSYYGGAAATLGDPFSVGTDLGGDTFAVTAAVPEPENMALLATGFGVLALAARRKNKRK